MLINQVENAMSKVFAADCAVDAVFVHSGGEEYMRFWKSQMVFCRKLYFT